MACAISSPRRTRDVRGLGTVARVPRHLCLLFLQRRHGDLAVARPNVGRRATGPTVLDGKGFVFLFSIRIPYNRSRYGRASLAGVRDSSLRRDAEFVPLAAVSRAIRQSPLESLGLPTKRFTEIG